MFVWKFCCSWRCLSKPHTVLNASVFSFWSQQTEGALLHQNTCSLDEILQLLVSWLCLPDWTLSHGTVGCIWWNIGSICLLSSSMYLLKALHMRKKNKKLLYKLCQNKRNNQISCKQCYGHLQYHSLVIAHMLCFRQPLHSFSVVEKHFSLHHQSSLRTLNQVSIHLQDHKISASGVLRNCFF